MEDQALAFNMSTCSNESNVTIDKNWSAECVASAAAEPAVDAMTWLMVVADGAILSIGLVGNALVIYVVARYARMKTVTNVYILNLSVADSMYLVGMSKHRRSSVSGDLSCCCSSVCR